MPTYARSRSSLEKSNNNGSRKNSDDMSASVTGKLDEERGSIGSGQNSLSSAGSDSESRLLSSNTDYDHIRNITLMFFLDRLFMASKDGKEARTLHDLSCLFGNKDFTKEMRQIVGASRNGLRKFLQSYPSLFTIEGDKVYLTKLKQDSNTSTARDYNREAVDYFTNKLLQFGASLVPIRNLFGYRSQASQEVRHVSGKSTTEFKQFLSAHSDVFEIMADEHVILKSALKELESRGEPVPSSSPTQNGEPDEKMIMDPYLNKRFAHFIEETLGQMLTDDQQEEERIAIERLHEKILNDCNNQLFLKMVKTINDLKMFLRMHPKLFKRNRCDDQEYVSLVTEQERLELEQQAYPLLGVRQHSTLRRTNTNESQELSSLVISGRQNINDNHKGPESLPPMPSTAAPLQSSDKPRAEGKTSEVEPSQHNVGGKTASGKQTKQQQITNESRSAQHRAPLTNNSKSNRSGTALRATAPPFVPSSNIGSEGGQNNSNNQPKSLQYISNQSHPCSLSSSTTSGAGSSLQRSVSNLGQPTVSSAVDQRQALRSYLLKASAGNNSPDGPYSPQKPANGAHYLNNNFPPNQPTGRQNRLGQLVVGGQNSDDIRARTVNVVKEASSIISRIMSSTDAVAFDCKGYNLGFNGQITLIQFAFLPNDKPGWTSTALQQHSQRLATTDKQQSKKLENQKPEVCVFDLITNPELAYCLKPLLESEQVVKIVHDVRNKSNALYVQFGIMLNHVFDTQVANLVIQQQETGKPVYKSRYISMGKLCEVYGNDSLLKYRNLIKSRTRHSSSSGQSSGKIKDVNYWRNRPLTDPMVCESIMDVYCLIGGVYQNLKSSIKPEYQPLFEQLNLEGVLARIKPDEIRSVKKERKIDLEVIDLKRKLYSDSTSCIVLSNREIRLLRHIDLTEEVRQKIQQCKKVSKKLERLDMKAAQLQSMDGQQSTDDGGERSLDPSQINGDTSLSSLQSAGEAGRVAASEAAAKLNAEVETEMSNLMDSSMFDELKDKMIESSSLLRSLEDDDDDANDDSHPNESVHGLDGRHSHHGDENCRCNCHRGSTDNSSNASADNKAATASLKSLASTDKDDASIESRAVDMAIQCDLLS